MSFVIGRGRYAREAYPSPPPPTASVALMLAVLANRKQGGISSGAGQSSTLTLDPITPTPGAPGNFEVSGYGTVGTSAPGDPISLQLLRDGSPVGPNQTLRTDSDGNFAFSIGPLVDPAGTPGPFTYAVQATNGTAGHTVEFVSGSALAQETL